MHIHLPVLCVLPQVLAHCVLHHMVQDGVPLSRRKLPGDRLRDPAILQAASDHPHMAALDVLSTLQLLLMCSSTNQWLRIQDIVSVRTYYH